jgi:hypothetical protein
MHQLIVTGRPALFAALFGNLSTEVVGMGLGSVEATQFRRHDGGQHFALDSR